MPLRVIVRIRVLIIIIKSEEWPIRHCIGLGNDTMTWWRYQMETFSALLAICAENWPIPGEFPAQRPVTRCFDIFFDRHPNKRLSKQWWGWWFETSSCPLWRHRNGMRYMLFYILTETLPCHDIIMHIGRLMSADDLSRNQTCIVIILEALDWYIHMSPLQTQRTPTFYLPTRSNIHDDVIKWKHFPRNCLYVRGIHRSPVNSPHKGQWRGALMFSLICAWINRWVNNRKTGDLRRYRAIMTSL